MSGHKIILDLHNPFSMSNWGGNLRDGFQIAAGDSLNVLKRDLSPNAEIIKIGEGTPDDISVQDAIDSILDTLVEAAQKNGTLSEVIFTGHGKTGIMKFGNETLVPLDRLLSELEKRQEEVGIKVADRFVFTGCNTFSNLNEDAQNLYSGAAVSMKMEIVGTLGIFTSARSPFSSDDEVSEDAAGRFVQYTPDGRLIIDKFDDPTYIDRAKELTEENAGWIKEHLPKDQLDNLQFKSASP